VPELLLSVPFTTLREGHRQKAFGSGVLRRIFGPKKDEIVGGQRKLNNEELLNLYSLPNVIAMTNERTMRWACGQMHIGFWWENQKERDQ
jgi:hypothetical protein